MIKAITVDLHTGQIADIAPMMKKVSEAAAAGKPGMLLAQIFTDSMKVFFATEEQAQDIQRAMGAPVGMMSRRPEHNNQPK